MVVIGGLLDVVDLSSTCAQYDVNIKRYLYAFILGYMSQELDSNKECHIYLASAMWLHEQIFQEIYFTNSM